MPLSSLLSFPQVEVKRGLLNKPPVTSLSFLVSGLGCVTYVQIKETYN